MFVTILTNRRTVGKPNVTHDTANGVNMDKSKSTNRIRGLVLAFLFLGAIFFVSGCASSSQGKSGKSFSFPSLPRIKLGSKEKKVEKDPNTPKSVEEWLAKPRNNL